jgi:lipopolysaccharide assembly outer membrane protein LptD (OstA)
VRLTSSRALGLGLLLAALSAPFPARAEEGAPAASSGGTSASGALASGEAQPAAAEEELVQKTLGLDISTASFYELVDWASSLGLPATGSAADLRAELYKHYGVEAPALKAGGRTVSIERADSAEYFRIEENDDSLLRITGGVVLTIRDEAKSELHRLEAEEILYDKTHNAVNAVGRVRYRREKASGVEEFSGETITVDLDDWSGVFLDGKMRSSSEASSGASTAASAAGAATGQRGFYFSADTMLKRSGDILILEDGIVTSCDAEHPHYSIRAKKIWLLGNNEWAISDAVLSLGELPVLWLPFFFYPGDEIVFHPVFGYRSRVGRFVQTTTYLIGQKPAKESTGILSLGGGSSGPKKVHGLFLRPTDEAGAKVDTSSSLKLLADVYSNLGAFVGLDGGFSKLGALTSLSLKSGLGLSRSLFYESTGYYSPFDAASDPAYTSVWNSSSLFGQTVPFRYGLDFSTGLKLGPVSATLALPLFSDPYFEKDFRWRSENMDWLSLSSSTSSSDSTEPSERSSYLQKLGFSFSLKPSFLSPWLSSIDVSTLASSLSWQTKYNTLLSSSEDSSLFSVDPQRYFFYPDLLRPLDLSLTLRGSLVPVKEGKAPLPTGDSKKGEGGLELRPPEDEASEGKPEEKETTSGTGDFRLASRAPSQNSSSSSSAGGLAIDWSLSPTAYIEDRYKSDSWYSSSQVDFSDLLYQLYSYSLSGSLKSSYSLPGGAASASYGLTLLSQDRNRTSTEDSSYASRIAAYNLTDAQYRQTKLSSSLVASARPFASSLLFGPSSLSYDLESILYSYSYSSYTQTGDNYSYNYDERYLGWDSDSITTHSASGTLGLKTGDNTQSLGLTMSLPPTTEAYTPALALQAGSKDSLYASASVRQRYYRASGVADFSSDPLSGNLSLTLLKDLTVTDSLAYDSDDGYFTSNVSTLAWGPLSTTLTAARAYSYTYAAGSGWSASSDKSFLVTNLAAACNGSWTAPKDWPFTSTVKAALSYSQSFLEFSDSILSFNLSLSFKLNNFLDLSFSSLSQNSSAWRYCPWLFSGVESAGEPESFYVNPLKDIAESFYFWDSSERKKSLFKLKSLSVKLSHDLHDWDMSFQLSASPSLDTSSTPYKYVIDPTFTFLLSWRDLPEIKSSVVKDSSGYTFE